MEKEDLTSFQPDFVPNSKHETFFPWEDVITCFPKKLDGTKFIGQIECPLCGQKSEKLVWIDFTSPGWTWSNLCGSAGNLSICPDCRIQVQYQMTFMN